MALALRTNGKQPARSLARDPFSFARELFGWDPFVVQEASGFIPTFDVKDTGETWVVKADVPGVLEKDLDIAVHDGVLTVGGSRAAEERKEGETYSLYERRYGAFARSFALPDAADPEKIDAKLDNGVLVLTIGKRAESKPRKIAIKK
jgi:HSP20 family protein